MLMAGEALDSDAAAPMLFRFMGAAYCHAPGHFLPYKEE